MGRIIISGGIGSSVTSDEVTASSSDVLAGKTAVTTDSNDEAGVGTMPYIGSARKAIDGGLNTQGLYYHIPKGYYQEGTNDPWVYLTQPEIAPIIGATGNKIIPGQSICGVPGAVPSLGAQTINPSISQQSIATFGKYMTGNITINSIPSTYLSLVNGVVVFLNGSFGTITNSFGYDGYDESKKTLDSAKRPYINGVYLQWVTYDLAYKSMILKKTVNMSQISYIKLSIGCSATSDTSSGNGNGGVRIYALPINKVGSITLGYEGYLAKNGSQKELTFDVRGKASGHHFIYIKVSGNTAADNNTYYFRLFNYTLL